MKSRRSWLRSRPTPIALLLYRRQSWQPIRRTVIPMNRLMQLGALVLTCLISCDGHEVGRQVPSPSADPDPPQGVPPAPAVVHGHFRGTAAAGDDLYHAEGLFTSDGEFRILVGRPVTNGDGPVTGGGLDAHVLNAAGSVQFVGQFAMAGNQREGDGILIGQGCAGADPGGFCDASTTAALTITEATSESLAGEVRTAEGGGELLWQLDLSAWSGYYESNSSNNVRPSGAFKEELAEFARDGDVVISIDGAGALFFQGAASGCTGNGSLTPHGDGRYYVFDITLTIENCNGDYASLNTEYAGLATETQNGKWDYDEWLLIFVATHDTTEPAAAAITLYSSRQ